MMGNTVQKGLWLDPRAKLFLILMCVLSSMFAPSLTYQFALVLLIAVLGVLCEIAQGTQQTWSAASPS